MSMSEEEATRILENFKNGHFERDKLERDDRCGGWKIGDIYKHLELNEAIETLIAKLEKKEDTISECRNRLAEKQLTINKLEMLAGLALKRGPLEISKKTFRELDSIIEIEQTENIKNDSYIFRAR